MTRRAPTTATNIHPADHPTKTNATPTVTAHRCPIVTTRPDAGAADHVTVNICAAPEMASTTAPAKKA
jgi:hypothetical protein